MIENFEKLIIGDLYQSYDSLKMSKWNGKKLASVKEYYTEICIVVKKLKSKGDRDSWILKTIDSDSVIVKPGTVTRVFENDEKSANWIWYGNKETHPELYL